MSNTTIPTTFRELKEGDWLNHGFERYSIGHHANEDTVTLICETIGPYGMIEQETRIRPIHRDRFGEYVRWGDEIPEDDKLSARWFRH
ncbi:hypothetical protein [Bifidobacterium biavatii]|uniref:Uncharacterized protein n=1 Tax=Bifidobacterium biavatii DSM 23969 TaxID=1437608 RepID=A0A086ZHX2_9BIFI|nr:hypothetical protein [Bifidobacterium biavatii]KFI46122.1 hypothetical protein BBIA_2087 [Bifidobacterium biavatii DSM 23969]